MNLTSKPLAIQYARRGWAVFPLKAKDKAPATRNGFKAATTDEAEVDKLFSRDDFNIGIATGQPSGVWVLDLDGEDGIKALAEWESKHGKLPPTLSASTGGGGRHLYFRLSGQDIRNTTKVEGKSIDVRGDGGYVVAPGSVHSSGELYCWENGDISPAEAPPWLVALVTAKDCSHSSFVRNDCDSNLTFIFGGDEDYDLATDPGASKGNRHDRACSLIGSALGKGIEQAEVANQALAWAKRCTPPMPDEEVLRIFADLSKRDTVKADAVVQEFEKTPLPPRPERPVLGDAAYHGIVGELVRTIEPQSEADPAGLLVSSLVALGNLLGREAYFTVEGTRHHTNLFAVLVGSTARGRKGTTDGRVRSVLKFVDEDWATERVQAGLVSGEGLIWGVRDAVHKREPIKEKGKVKDYQEVETDPGIEDKRLLVVESEFATVLRACKRETNTLSPTIRSAWDSGNLRTLAKNSPAVATDAHISIIGHITGEELRRAMAEVEAFSGFGNRFLWVSVSRSKLLPDGGQDLDLSNFAERLCDIKNYATTITRMRRDDTAGSLWREIYRDLANGSGGLLGALTSRGEAQVLRLSMVYALLDQSDTIRVDHLQAARAVWAYCYRSAALIFGDSTGNMLADKLLDLIRTSPGINRREMHQHFKNHAKAADLVEALTLLRDLGLAEGREVQTAGRPAERWYPTAKSSCEVSNKANEGGGVAPGPVGEQSEQCEQRHPLHPLLLTSQSDDSEGDFEEVRI